MERGIDVDNEAGVVVIGDGNDVVLGAGAPVRSAYREQVRRIAPPELVGREEELAELAEFCRTGTGYRWWRADAWAGKTALMASFALAPPPGVRIVPFFVTARLGAQNDVVAYVDVVLEQLAELAGEGLPALLTAATREAHLLRLYASAAEACAARGERLVLLVDGLDEDRGVTTGPEARSIAALLPYGVHDLPVVVSGRLNPPLPADVPEDHPLRDPSIVRLLSSSPKARAIRSEAERELKHFVAGGGLPYELLGLLTAAGGGLTADDLAELTDEVPYRVRDVLRTGPGRTFALRGEAYLLAHEELVVQAREMLGSRELGRWRAALCDWAEEWRARGWPDGTPDYLLHGWFPMLRAAGDPDAMAACALDAVRQDRMLAATGGDGAALGEITTAGEALLERGDRPGLVVDLLRLALRRAALRDRNGRVPVELPLAWAELGEVERGVALARGLEPPSRVRALCGVARFLHADGAQGRALALLDEVDELARSMPYRGGNFTAFWEVANTWLELGEPERAEKIAQTVPGRHLSGGFLLNLVTFWCSEGKFSRALDMLRTRWDERVGSEAIAIVCSSLVEAGQEAEALALARSMNGYRRTLALVRMAAVTRRNSAATLVDEGLAVFRWEGLFYEREHAAELIESLVAVGAVERAESLISERRGSRHADHMRLALVRSLSKKGECGRAETMAYQIEAGNDGDRARAALVEAWARIGDVGRAGPALAELTDHFSRFSALQAVIGALVRAERVQEAEALVFREAGIADLRNLALKVHFVRSLTRAGHRVRAATLLDHVETTSRLPQRKESIPVLASVAEALALAGHSQQAWDLTEGLETDADQESRILAVVRALLSAGRFEEAERQSQKAHADQTEYLLDLIGRIRKAQGVDQILKEFERPDITHDSVRWMAGDGMTRSLLPVPENQVSALEVERRAMRAFSLHEEGRSGEALREVTRAVAATRGILACTTAPLPAVVRALSTLGQMAVAGELLDEAASYVKRLQGRQEWSYVARAFVAVGRYDEAIALVRPQGNASTITIGRQLDLVTALARDGQQKQAEDLLDSLARLGLARARAYADLALTHPDPTRARELTALALHTGPWYEALPAVLRYEPGALPFVLAEADRLHRALDV
ncbi:hypothetical protein [Streptomyces sp. NPDC098101]|uniref:hypothetical protein n=1 Tax=Streptomyces sp. NPDC098101 TaxID=3366096 RepID=UPI0038073A37